MSKEKNLEIKQNQKPLPQFTHPDTTKNLKSQTQPFSGEPSQSLRKERFLKYRSRYKNTQQNGLVYKNDDQIYSKNKEQYITEKFNTKRTHSNPTKNFKWSTSMRESKGMKKLVVAHQKRTFKKKAMKNLENMNNFPKFSIKLTKNGQADS